MPGRLLDVTAKTTLDHVDARATGDGWSDDGVGVVDVESPRDADAVALQIELDPTALAHLAPHATTASLSPGQARTLAADLEAAADAAEDDDATTSGRSRG